jgi:hypothetical protein
MGGKSSAPPPPDYKGAAQEQAAASKEAVTAQTWANRPTIETPWGTQSWTTNQTVDPATGQAVTGWTQHNAVDPATQKALDSQQALQQQRSDLAAGMIGRVGQEIGQPMDWSKYGQGQGLQMDPEQARQSAIENSMQQYSSRADPRFARGEDQLRTRLANQGITQGSDAYDQSMREFQQNKEDAYKQAQFSAIGTGGAEAQRMQGMDVTGANFANTLRSQGMAEEMQRRGFSLNEINALMTQQQVAQPNMPGFQNSGMSQTPQILNATQMGYDAALGANNAQNAQAGQTMQTVGSIAGIAAMAF